MRWIIPALETFLSNKCSELILLILLRLLWLLGLRKIDLVFLDEVKAILFLFFLIRMVSKLALSLLLLRLLNASVLVPGGSLIVVLPRLALVVRVVRETLLPEFFLVTAAAAR